MDSGAKGFFRKLKRIQFWIICPVVILTGLASWWLAVGSIQKQQETNKSRISGLYNTLSLLSNQPRHANDKVSEGMEALIAKRRNEVAEAWTERWDQQTGQTNIFEWPGELGPRFISKVEGLRPIETTVGFPPEQDLAINMRRDYRDYIKEELPKLAEQIGAKWKPGAQRGGGAVREGGRRRRFEGGQPPPVFDEGQLTGGATVAFGQSLVGWNPENQADIETSHFDWSGTPPGLLEILYAHEDLTVLRSIMNVISKANEGAATRFNAAVKEIEFIRIGKNASRTTSRVYRPAGAGPGPAGMPTTGWGQEGGRSGRFEGQTQRFEGAQQGEGRPLEGRPVEGRFEGAPRFEGEGRFQGPGLDPADNRYVDNQYNPLPAATLRSVLKKPRPGEVTEPIDPQFAYLAVAKRIPVRMRLRVDQRKLNRLLAECA